MGKHTVMLTDEELRMVIIGLDVYAESWQGYSKKRDRDMSIYRGVRANSPEEKQRQELCRADVLAANNIVKAALKTRDHLARLLKPSQV